MDKCNNKGRKIVSLKEHTIYASQQLSSSSGVTNGAPVKELVGGREDFQEVFFLTLHKLASLGDNCSFKWIFFITTNIEIDDVYLPHFSCKGKA
jgi:hypothetical protein